MKIEQLWNSHKFRSCEECEKDCGKYEYESFTLRALKDLSFFLLAAVVVLTILQQKRYLGMRFLTSTLANASGQSRIRRHIRNWQIICPRGT